MKRILCPIDFSPSANNAVEYAAKFARDLKAELTLLHVLDKPSLQGMETTADESSEEGRVALEMINKMETYCETIKQSFSIPCRATIGPYASKMEIGLKKEVKANTYDLMVMGTDGNSDLSQFFLGTHTSHIIGNVPVPVIVVPDGCVYREMQNIVYASNYRLEDIPSLGSVMKLTQSFEPRITVLHVNRKQAEEDQGMVRLLQDVYRDKLKNQDIMFYQVASEQVALAIDSYAEQNEADLLVLVTQKYSWIQSIFHDSVTKKISLLANYPVLVLNFPDEAL